MHVLSAPSECLSQCGDPGRDKKFTAGKTAASKAIGLAKAKAYAKMHYDKVHGLCTRSSKSM